VGQTPPVRQTPLPSPTPKTGARHESSEASATPAFVKAAAQGSMSEVELATLGKTSRDDVKTLAQTIKDDHEEANSELKSLATDKHWTLPMQVSAAQKATADRLSKLSGAAFDRAYVDDVVKDHQHDVAEFKKHESDPNADVRECGAKTRPTLETRLSKAEAVQKAIKNAGR
jgi:putative membrane protein